MEVGAADRRAMPPEECRSEGTPSLGEGPDARGEAIFCLLFLGACKKSESPSGETISRHDGTVINFVFGHNMLQRCMYAD